MGGVIFLVLGWALTQLIESIRVKRVDIAQFKQEISLRVVVLEERLDHAERQDHQE